MPFLDGNDHGDSTGLIMLCSANSSRDIFEGNRLGKEQSCLSISWWSISTSLPRSNCVEPITSISENVCLSAVLGDWRLVMCKLRDVAPGTHNQISFRPENLEYHGRNSLVWRALGHLEKEIRAIEIPNPMFADLQSYTIQRRHSKFGKALPWWR
jgi:hypothetical protein